eukprot:scaffold26496_cov113-Cylindrotheca_fusiformis.AAC.2
MASSEQESLLAKIDDAYGSTPATRPKSESNLRDHDAFDVEKSFHLGNKKLNRNNVLASMRLTESFQDHGGEYDLVPSLLEDNVVLVVDSNLSKHDRGRLYLAESGFYNTNENLRYAITVNDDIYARIIKEVNDSHKVPCGLYFCCHGGEGADSHTDHVDIEFAWITLGVIFVRNDKAYFSSWWNGPGPTLALLKLFWASLTSLDQQSSRQWHSDRPKERAKNDSSEQVGIFQQVTAWMVDDVTLNRAASSRNQKKETTKEHLATIPQ